MKKLAIIVALSAATQASAKTQADKLIYVSGDALITPYFAATASGTDLKNLLETQGLNTTVIGGNASATGDNSIAIGYGSVATEANTMAVGGRKIVGVVAGVSDTDAVNVSQLKAGISEANTYTNNTVNNAVTTLNQTIVQGDAQTLNQANAYTDSKVSTVINNVRNESRQYTDARFNEVNDAVKRIGAMAMLNYAQDHNPCKRSSLAVAVGGYRGKYAVGAQYAYKTTHNTRLQATVAYDSKHVGYGVSGNYSWE